MTSADTGEVLPVKFSIWKEVIPSLSIKYVTIQLFVCLYPAHLTTGMSFVGLLFSNLADILTSHTLTHIKSASLIVPSIIIHILFFLANHSITVLPSLSYTFMNAALVQPKTVNSSYGLQRKSLEYYTPKRLSVS